jgi:branched-chain amino acid transport system ATP-binding protein
LACSIEISDIEAGYGTVRVLHGVSISVNDGETVVLLGSNGNGKSTLIKCIAGLVAPTAGRVVLKADGRETDLVGKTPEEIVGLGVALVPEGRRLFPALTVEENLMLGAYRKAARRNIVANLDFVLTTFPVLAQRRNQLAGSMSGGEQQMVAVARALMSEPKLLLLDEPSLGLGPKLVKDLFAILKAIGRSGQSVVLVEQNVRQSLRLADHVYVLENGRIERSGSAAELEKDAAIQKAYLGLTGERRPERAQFPARERWSAGGFVNPFARSVAQRNSIGHEEEQPMPHQQDGSGGSGFFHPFARTVGPRPAKAARPIAPPAAPHPELPPSASSERPAIPTTGGFVNPQARPPRGER